MGLVRRGAVLRAGRSTYSSTRSSSSSGARSVRHGAVRTARAERMPTRSGPRDGARSSRSCFPRRPALPGLSPSAQGFLLRPSWAGGGSSGESQTQHDFPLAACPVLHVDSSHRDPGKGKICPWHGIMLLRRVTVPQQGPLLHPTT